MSEVQDQSAELRQLDREALLALVLDQREKLLHRNSDVEHLKLIIAQLRRMMFGKKSEKNLTGCAKNLQCRIGSDEMFSAVLKSEILVSECISRTSHGVIRKPDEPIGTRSGSTGTHVRVRATELTYTCASGKLAEH